MSKMPSVTAITVLVLVLVAGMPVGQAQQAHRHDMHASPPAVAAGTEAADSRQLVQFPERLRIHTLSNMRDHLRVLQEIQAALAAADYDGAATLAEQRLGMDSLALHGAHEVAPYMPEGMQAIGTGMHRAASRFSLAVGNVGATGDLRPALAALATLTERCVACHAAYRLQ